VKYLTILLVLILGGIIGCNLITPSQNHKCPICGEQTELIGVTDYRSGYRCQNSHFSWYDRLTGTLAHTD